MIPYTNLDQYFSIHYQYINSYNAKIEEGKNYLKKSKIAIVGLCRNNENIIDKNLQQIISTFDNKCLEYKIILFENDSIDNTKQKILNFQKKNTNIELISQNYNRPQFASIKDQSRITALAEYRNILNQHIKENYSHFDFTIVIDTDFSSINENGIYNSFGWLSQENSIGAIAGNSFEIRPVFDLETPMLWNYDSWAFRGSWWEDLDNQPRNQFNNYNSMFWFGIWVLPIGSPPVRINSAFGGLCVYRNHFYLTGEYRDYDCEHVTFNWSIKNNNPDFHLYLNPSQVTML